MIPFKDLPKEEKERILLPHRDVITELRQYVGGDSLPFKNRKEAANAVAKFFREMAPKTEEEYNKFYRDCKDYIFENAYCNKEGSCVLRTTKLRNIFLRRDIKTVHEIGCGVGTYALSLERAGFDVSVLRSNDDAFKFFEWRMKLDKYKSQIKILDDTRDKKFDCIFFLDVIEHVYDPYKFLTNIAQCTDTIVFVHGFGVHREDMGGYPQHFDHKLRDIRKHLEGLGFKKEKIEEPFPPHVYVRG